MGITLADVDRWDPDAVREFFHAATQRGRGTHATRDGITGLAAFQTWDGRSADAAWQMVGKARKDLDAHGEEAIAVGRAASLAADDIVSVKSRLASIRSEANAIPATISSDGRVLPTEESLNRSTPAVVAERTGKVILDIKALLAEADRVDGELANALSMAAGTTPIPPGPHDSRVDIQRALGEPLPTDPAALAALWKKLTPEEKDWLYSQDHAIGNRDGILAVDRDHYNRMNLADQLRRARAGDPALKDKLPDLEAVDDTMSKQGRFLLLLDTGPGHRPHAAVAVGNPDTANHISITTPGMNTTVRGAIGGMTDEATRLRDVAVRQLQSTPGHGRDSVSTIAWIGYDPPQLSTGVQGVEEVSHDQVARAAAPVLAHFYDGIHASHQGAPAQVTAIGHSYGSLTTGLALQQPGNHGISDAVFYGSPGIEADTPQQLGVQSGHVYTLQTPDDPIRNVYPEHVGTDHRQWWGWPAAGLEWVGKHAGFVGSGPIGDFGSDPATNPNFTHLETGDATAPDGHGGTQQLEGSHGHADYPRDGDGSRTRTTVYNLAAVIAGLTQNEIPDR